MADREKSAVSDHDTFPGTGPSQAQEGGSGIHAVEQMVDAAIERLALERQSAGARTLVGPGQAPGAPLVRKREIKPEVRTTGLSVAQGRDPSVAIVKRGSGRLRWKGLEVSDEFRRYAERVARGEDLPPFTGQILAEPNSSFPWDPAAKKRASRRAMGLQLGLWGSAAVVLGLLGWSIALRLTGSPPQRAESASNTTVLSSQLQPAVAAATDSTVTSEPALGAASSGAASSGAATSEAPSSLESAGTSEVLALSEAVEPPSSLAVEPVEEPRALAADPAPAAPSAPTAPAPAPAREPSPAPSRGGAAVAASAPEAASTAIDVSRPGALKEALGALLAARSAPNGPAAAAAPSPAATEAPPSAGEAPPTPSGSDESPTRETGATPDPNPSPAPASSEKEPGARRAGTLLVETPSF